VRAALDVPFSVVRVALLRRGTDIRPSDYHSGLSAVRSEWTHHPTARHAEGPELMR
jgi:hypothetical protein